MPNTGKPSQDCHLCRSRRVKCDLARPSCQRCIKYGVECPGYRDQQDLIFRNANPTTVNKRKKRADQAKLGASPESSDVSVSRSTTPASRQSTPSLLLDDNGYTAVLTPDSMDPTPLNASAVAGEAQLHLPLTQPLTEHWTAHSVPIVLNVYSTLQFLNGMYSSCPPDGPLVWAAHLFARAYVTNLRYPTAIHSESVRESQRELGAYMGKTLSAVSDALQTPDGAFRDDILATVWVLSNYELLVGSIGQMQFPSPWHLHTRGLYSILKTRGIRSLRSEVGRAAFWSSFILVQIESIISTTEGPAEAEGWLSVIREEMVEDERVILNVSTFMSKVAKIQCRMLNTLRRNDYETASEEYFQLVGDLTRAENDADVSYANTPPTGDSFDTYWRNIYCAAIVKCYHITHLLINFLTHYSSCPVTLHQLQNQRDYCLQRIRGAAHEILSFSSSVLDTKFIRNDKSPKALFDALKVVWPLTAVYITPSTLPDQKSQAEMSLYFIGRELGIRQALHTYPGLSAGQVPEEAQAPLGIGEPENFEWVGRLG